MTMDSDEREIFGNNGKDRNASLKRLYSAMQSAENRLGGGEGVEGIYGSITRIGTEKIMEAMTSACDAGKDSILVDVGSGLCRPIVHAVLASGVARGIGLEVDPVKCQKAKSFIKQIGRLPFVRDLLESPLEDLVEVRCTPMEDVVSLPGATHMYAFWEGIPSSAKHAAGRLFLHSKTLQSVAIVQRCFRGRSPAEQMEEYGFGSLELQASFPVSMGGSGRTFTSYVFRKSQGLPRPKTIAPTTTTSCRQETEVVREEKVYQQSVLKRKRKDIAASTATGGIGSFFPLKKVR